MKAEQSPSLQKPSPGLLAAMTDQLDNRIVAACNELMKLKVLTAKQKVDNRNERASLMRAMQEQIVLLDGRLRTSRHAKDLTEYQAACDRAFNEDGVNIPAFASLRQAQLCLNIHNMTVLDNQIALLKQQRKQEISLLESERNKLIEESATSEVLLLNQVVKLEREIRDLQSKLAAVATMPSSSTKTSGESNTPSPRCVLRKKSADSTSTVDTDHSFEGEGIEASYEHQGNNNNLNRWTSRFFQTARFSAPSRPKVVEMASNIR
jgi:hypothetical protein